MFRDIDDAGFKKAFNLLSLSSYYKIYNYTFWRRQ